MSEMQKYWTHNDLMEVELKNLRAIECNNVDQYYRADEVDAAMAADKARIEVLERAVEWCLENGAQLYSMDVDSTGDGGICDAEGNDLEVPTDLAEIIKAVKP